MNIISNLKIISNFTGFKSFFHSALGVPVSIPGATLGMAIGLEQLNNICLFGFNIGIQGIDTNPFVLFRVRKISISCPIEKQLQNQ